jgi:hypothetical protein
LFVLFIYLFFIFLPERKLDGIFLPLINLSEAICGLSGRGSEDASQQAPRQTRDQPRLALPAGYAMLVLMVSLF